MKTSNSLTFHALTLIVVILCGLEEVLGEKIDIPEGWKGNATHGPKGHRFKPKPGHFDTETGRWMLEAVAQKGQGVSKGVVVNDINNLSYEDEVDDEVIPQPERLTTKPPIKKYAVNVPINKNQNNQYYNPNQNQNQYYGQNNQNYQGQNKQGQYNQNNQNYQNNQNRNNGYPNNNQQWNNNVNQNQYNKNNNAGWNNNAGGYNANNNQKNNQGYAPNKYNNYG